MTLPPTRPRDRTVWAWEQSDVREALRVRDVGALLRAVRKYGGISQSRIAVDRRDVGAEVVLAVFPEIAPDYDAQAAAREEIQRHARTAAALDVLAVRGLGPDRPQRLRSPQAPGSGRSARVGVAPGEPK